MGEVVLLGGAAGSYYLAQDQLAVMQDYNVTLDDYNAAKNNYDTYRYANIACLSAAGALYVYNLVRAYTMTPKYKNRNLTFTPALLPMEQGMASGVSLTLKF